MVASKNYTVPVELDPGEILQALAKKYILSQTVEESLEQEYLDTFDWRLFFAGLALYRRGYEYVVESGIDSIRLKGRGSRKKQPFWWDFKNEQFQQELRPITDIRALMPRFILQGKKQGYALLNDDAKTISRLTILSLKVHCAQDAHELPTFIQVHRLKGYDKPFDTVVKSLESLKLTALKHDLSLVGSVHGLIGIDAAATGSKFTVSLAFKMTVAEAVRDICLRLRDDMMQNMAGAKADIDSEFLHDFRVATRRTRSLLTLLKKNLPKADLAPFISEFKWLGSWTGPVRDLDVFLLRKGQYREILPSALHPGMDFFFDELERERRKNLGQLRRHMASERFQTLVSSWEKFLMALPEHPENPDGERNCRKVAAKIIRKRFKKILRDGGKITSSSTDDTLHNLRIEAKKFRYLLEFFRSLFVDKAVGNYLKQLKKLQNNLGDFNDLSIQSRMLSQRLALLGGAKEQGVATGASLGGLIVHLQKEQKRVRKRFEKTFREFSSRENISLLESIFQADVAEAKDRRTSG